MEAKEHKSGDFVSVVGRDLEENGIPEGSLLYLAGDTFIRESEQDPYLFRKAFIAARIKDYHIQAEEKPFLITAKNLGGIEEFERLALEEAYQADFGGDDNE